MLQVSLRGKLIHFYGFLGDLRLQATILEPFLDVSCFLTTPSAPVLFFLGSQVHLQAFIAVLRLFFTLWAVSSPSCPLSRKNFRIKIHKKFKFPASGPEHKKNLSRVFYSKKKIFFSFTHAHQK